ncbi:hypothetical protein [Streptomyces endophytica]|uniref:Uncharacterized protein n=1 Tax=Streptomyces endophytica TaxID=2991496 RepID=A0ABY6PI73_9ACTN|nr:hypothetical protein [Streptomyces endophytica]UZJ33578.1 hypothetical protein OJ254_28970 [Streptomyces endophytica]
MSASTTARTARRRTLRIAAGWSGLQSTDAKTAITSAAADKQSGGTHATGGAKTGTPVRTQTLADGISKAEIYQLDAQHYRAKIVARGSVVATMETTGQDADAGLDANDMYIVLSAGGVLSAHK